MLIILSPAKKLNFEKPSKAIEFSQPKLTEHSQLLINELRSYKIDDLANLMRVSISIAELNFERFFKWNLPFDINNSKQAISAFTGQAYLGLKSETFSEKDYNYAQKHLRILSGLYGVLRPLDLIQAYRLEMGTKLQNKRGNNLYEFWGDIVTNELNMAIKETGNKILVNLASSEYSKVINPKVLDAEIITPIFKDEKNGTYKVISVYAKTARGLMSRFIIKNQINNPNDLSAFNYERYAYNAKMSDKNNIVFTR
ncbi:MAG: peroxide stress protein YaaA [Bacteroidales bacterium]|nr:peroxide stress protein YaaA [Bacteroidales bacterium]